ncbi:hypothetical protein ALO_02316 [Acetonema longum DSM 6540]|uniref:Uncharacterized protein n=1 Tax=Acetonema longum DSM 6540 TaxID=1009370 RepID=F7NEK0_9FIRM|nr:hypothetical protein ALO_02316 [Acetonema longum DSM 6540]
MLNAAFNIISVSAMFTLLWTSSVILITACWMIIRKILRISVSTITVRRIIWIGSVAILLALLANGNIQINSPYSW